MDAIKKLFRDDDNKQHKTTHHEEHHHEVKTSSKATTAPIQPQIAANQQQHVANQQQQSFTATSESSESYKFGADKDILEAQRLQHKGCQQLETSEATAMAARSAQAEVERASQRANIVTNQALRQEVEGQKTLVEAGQKLMEAGSKLQQEAANIHTTGSAELSYVQRGAVQQTTNVDVQNIQAAEMQVLQNRVVGECRPVVDTQVRTERIETHQKDSTHTQQRTAEIH